MKKILLFALLFRLVLAPLTYHGDTIDSLNWGKNLYAIKTLGFYYRDTPDAGPPNYPPGYYLLLSTNQYTYESVKTVLWKINTSVKLFPSNIYIWFESDQGKIFFNKLPSIFSDLAIGYLIYLILINLKKKKLAKLSAALFLFSPPIWYNSTLWGQTESMFALPLVWSFYETYIKKRVNFGIILFMISLLIKPTAVFISPIFIYLWIRSKDYKRMLYGAFIALFIFFLTHVPFEPTETFSFILNLYRYQIREILSYLVANAFNLWSLVYGFEPRPETILFLGVPANIVGFAIYVLVLFLLIKRLNKESEIKPILLSLVILSLASFFFLTRMHERYFYLVLLFLAPLVGLDKNLKKVFIILSTVHLINLYHYWWVPNIDILVKIFSNSYIEKLLSITNFVIFLLLFKMLRKGHEKE